MIKAKHLNKISKLHNDNSVLSKIEKMMIEAASKGEYEIEIDSDLLNDPDIREKLKNKGFELYHGDITTCISWRNI